LARNATTKTENAIRVEFNAFLKSSCGNDAFSGFTVGKTATGTIALGSWLLSVTN